MSTNQLLRAAFHLLAWSASITSFGALDIWLGRSRHIELHAAAYDVYGAVLLVWALWIFGRCFSYRPVTPFKVAGFAAFIAALGCAAYAGLLALYFVLVLFLGGE